jgi:hypothetical protein
VKRSKVLGAQTAKEMLDHIDDALASIDMHLAAFFTPLTPAVLGHSNSIRFTGRATCRLSLRVCALRW